MRIEFLIVVALAVGATFFVVAVSSALVINKRLEMQIARRRQKLSEFYSHMFADLLLKSVDTSSLTTKGASFALYEEMVKPIKTGLAWSTAGQKGLHREAMKLVLIDFARDLEGEALDRLLYFFYSLGFVDEEIQSLKDKRWWVRAQAARDLGLLRAKRGIAPLSAALEDDNPDVRTQAIQSLVMLAGVEALRTILRATRNMSRWTAVELSVIVRKFEGEAIPFLIEALQSPDLSVVLFSIEMLAQIGFVSAVDTLLEIVRTYPNVVVRAKAVEALGRLGDQRTEPLLRELIKNPYPSLRMGALKALGRIGSPASVPMLVDRLKTGEFSEQLSAARAIAKSGSGGVAALQSLIEREDPGLRGIARQVLEEIGSETETV